MVAQKCVLLSYNNKNITKQRCKVGRWTQWNVLDSRS